MNQCHECGNKLTEVDAFCPFCGITLEPLVAEEEKDSTSDDLIEETPAEPVNSKGQEEEYTDISSVFDEEEEVGLAANEVPESSETTSDDDGFVDISSLSEEDEGVEELSQPEEDLPQPAEEIPVSDESVAASADDEQVLDSSELAAEEESSISAPPIEHEVLDSSEPLSEEANITDPPLPTEIPILQEAEEEEAAPDVDFLEDSTVMMSSFPKLPSDDLEEEKEPEVLASEAPEEAEAAGDDGDMPDLEGDTIIAGSGSLDLPSKPVNSEVELAEESADDEVLSKTIDYVPSDLEELKHIEISGKDLIPLENQETALDKDSDAASAFAPINDLENQVDAVETTDEAPLADKAQPLDETRDGSAQQVESGVVVSAAEVNAAAEKPETQADEQPPHSDTTPNIGVEDTDGSNKKKLKPLEEGTVLNNRYEIVRKIGGGGMGAVYLANDKNLGGVLRAVKEMVQSYIEEEQQVKAINDFKRESMLLTSLEHPSIPTIYDYFFDEAEARFYLVMKYISGGDLSGKVRSTPEGRLDEKSVVEWGSQIADVLDYLHNRQPPIVYRDLKPANVMVDGNSGRVMLIDFGIARWVNKEEKGVTAVGTMGYAPPELFSGNVEPRSDIYSLGSTMFHLLTGADPQSNPLLIFDFQKHPRPRQINPALSDQVEQILMRAVEYSADKRFSSAAEMRDALTSHLERLKSGSASYGLNETPEAVGLADQPVFCGFCGQKIVATDMFCAFCGAKQPLAQPGVHSEEYAPAGLTVKLLVEGTSDLEAPAFSLVKDDNLLGRRDPISDIFPEVDLSKYDPQTKISRKHARIWREGDRFMLEDLNSSNGTLVRSPRNESIRLTPHQSHVLTNGDKIQMGDTILHFLIA